MGLAPVPSVFRILFLVCMILAAPAGATTWFVEKDGSGDFTDIQPAVEAAAPGDTIRIGYGRFDTLHPSCVAPAWTEDAIVTVVHDNLTFIGEGPHSTVLGMSEFYWSESKDPKGFCSIDGYSATIKDLRIENIEQGIYWWGGRLDVENWIIRGAHPSFGAIKFAADNGNLRDCRIEMGGGGGIGVTCAYSDSLNISNCVFDGFGYGFSTAVGAKKISISDCDFYGNSNAIAVYYGSFGKISNVTISNTVSQAIIILNSLPVTLNGVHIDGAVYGLIVDGTMGGEVIGTNVIIENTTMEAVIMAADAPVTLNNSHILPASGVGVLCAGYWGDFQTLDFTGNYWGTTDPDSIADMIIDQNDDPTLQCIVQFEPFAKGPVPTEKKSLGSFKSMFR